MRTDVPLITQAQDDLIDLILNTSLDIDQVCNVWSNKWSEYIHLDQLVDMWNDVCSELVELN